MLDKEKVKKIDILTKRSIKLKNKCLEKGLEKGERRKAIRLWIKVLKLIKSEYKSLKIQ
jgi:hypothetical protein